MTVQGRINDTGRQRGGAAVEFTFVFPVLFLLVYGIVVYSYIYVVQQAITYAVQVGAEAAVAVDPAVDSADTLKKTTAQAAAYSALSWLPAHQLQTRIGGKNGIAAEICPAGGTMLGVTCPLDSNAIVVRITYTIATPQPLFPVISLPFVGPAPPMPAQLSAAAVARI
ncbi:Flp pilus assembly protein TadG [Fontimonas thermophila]|uniref:Flp pilus assembly protein TadG n=2 Tax=Fontimonas thermophila TaxID=1076937 RepID=A0A1I2I8S8_9GAMM|nr:Flp pilus assembly protein TadG [Fontimonas thermophila]